MCTEPTQSPQTLHLLATSARSQCWGCPHCRQQPCQGHMPCYTGHGADKQAREHCAVVEQHESSCYRFLTGCQLCTGATLYMRQT